MKKFLLILFLSASLVVSAQNDIYRAHFRPYRLGVNLLHGDMRLSFPLIYQLEGAYMKKDGMLDARVKLNSSLSNFDKATIHNYIFASTDLNLSKVLRNQYIFEASIGMNFRNKYKDPAMLVKTITHFAGTNLQYNSIIVEPGCKLYNMGMHGGLGRQQTYMDYDSSRYELNGPDLYDVFDSSTKSPYIDQTFRGFMSNTFVFIGAHIHRSSKAEKFYDRIGYGGVSYLYFDILIPVMVNYEKIFDNTGKDYTPTKKNDKSGKMGYRIGTSGNGTGFIGKRTSIEFGKMPGPFEIKEEHRKGVSLFRFFNYASVGIGFQISPTKKVIEFPYR